VCAKEVHFVQSSEDPDDAAHSAIQSGE